MEGVRGGGVLGAGDVGDHVLDAQLCPQGSNVLTGEVLLGGVREAQVVAQVRTGRCGTPHCPGVCCGLATHSTPLARCVSR